VKELLSTVLLALDDTDYCFISIDEVAYSASSDSNICKNTNFCKILYGNNLHIPGARPLPNDDYCICVPFVTVGDVAFVLSQLVLRPYPSRNLDICRRIYRLHINYQSSMQNHIFTNTEQKYMMLLPFERGIFAVS
jgi:hypothetical protein